MDTLRLALAQINTTVGDLQGNFEKIVANLKQAQEAEAHIVLFPELAISGYPPEDLLLKFSFSKANQDYLNRLLPHSQGLTAIIGFVDVDDDIYNAAAILHHGQLAGVYRKFLLPNYGVFDEDRYFKRGDIGSLFSLGNVPLGVSVCEDIWYPAGPPEHQAANGAQLLLNISASPYYAGKIQERERMLITRASDNVAVVAYCNLVGGQDELIFDGSSVIIDERGKVIARAKSFAEELLIADVDLRGILRQRLKDPRRRKDFFTYNSPYAPLQNVDLKPGPAPSAVPLPPPSIAAPLSSLEEVYTALVLGVREYVHKNGFEKVVIGLSGGIDSSLVAAIAADALGSENVIGVSMPSRYSSDHSKSDAWQLAQNLDIRYESIPIERIFQGYLDTLAPQFEGTSPNETEENLQSRARGNILMALSNKFGWLVLTTGNKSEMAVGYATLYGDMAGGFAVIKDAPKTLVYQLCRYRNLSTTLKAGLSTTLKAGLSTTLKTGLSTTLKTGLSTTLKTGLSTTLKTGLSTTLKTGLSTTTSATLTRSARLKAGQISQAIPQNVIDKPPSAELRPDQFDTDSLPPYDVLDDILKCYVEDDYSFNEILARGHAPETVRRVIILVDRNEYKRRQAPPGVKITSRSFGKDRRLPITNRYSAAGDEG